MRDPHQADFDMASACPSEAERGGYDSTAQVAKPTSKRRRQALEKIVETRIIPRLLIADFQAPPALQVVPADSRHLEKIGEFAELLIGRDGESSVAYFQQLHAQGASVEELFQDLLVPTALRLGELWDEDINDFMDVTRGFTHLQRIVQTHSEDFRVEGRNPISNRRALLMPLPNEQHVFGVSLVGQYFRREGWRVWGGPPRSVSEMTELVEGQWFDVVGLSCSAVKDQTQVAHIVKTVRAASLNKGVTILIGGFAFLENPDLVAAVGADSTAANGPQAISRVHERLGKTKRR
jgi:methanogenic corrinoid protein MtbC1